MQAGGCEFVMRYVWSAYGGAATNPAPLLFHEFHVACRATFACCVRLALPSATGLSAIRRLAEILAEVHRDSKAGRNEGC